MQQTYTGHVMSANSNTQDVGKCPYLKDSPIGMNTARRESNARSYNRRVPFAIAKGVSSPFTPAPCVS